MTGEVLAWYRVASHLKVPVQELIKRITFSEFLDWLQYLEWAERRDTKNDYYLAQIAAEVRRGNVKSPRLVKIKDLLLKMQKPKQRLSSKQIWLQALGIKLKE